MFDLRLNSFFKDFLHSKNALTAESMEGIKEWSEMLENF